jgi:hypothetical protein
VPRSAKKTRAAIVRIRKDAEALQKFGGFDVVVADKV